MSDMKLEDRLSGLIAARHDLTPKYVKDTMELLNEHIQDAPNNSFLNNYYYLAAGMINDYQKRKSNYITYQKEKLKWKHTL